jgi:hypothetical protein
MKTIPYLLLLALSVFSAPTFAQTKEATEAWIIEQSADNIAGLSYEIEGDTLKSVYEYPSLGTAGGGTTERTVQLRDVKTISMVHTDTNLSFKLVCETDCTYESTTIATANLKRKPNIKASYSKSIASLINPTHRACKKRYCIWLN